MSRQLISSGAPWESEVGYSRAVRMGSIVFVAGTTAVDEEGHVVGPGDGYAQTKHIFTIIEKALQEAGAGLVDVVSYSNVCNRYCALGWDRPCTRGDISRYSASRNYAGNIKTSTSRYAGRN